MYSHDYVVPNATQLRNLGPGCFAQIHASDDNFWVEIESEDKGVFTGVVHCIEPGSGHMHCNNEKVSFTADQIRYLGCDRFCFC